MDSFKKFISRFSSLVSRPSLGFASLLPIIIVAIAAVSSTTPLLVENLLNGNPPGSRIASNESQQIAAEGDKCGCDHGPLQCNLVGKPCGADAPICKRLNASQLQGNCVKQNETNTNETQPRLKGNGEECKNPDECSSGVCQTVIGGVKLCIGGTAELKDEGEVCKDGPECKSGRCDKVIGNTKICIGNDLAPQNPQPVLNCSNLGRNGCMSQSNNCFWFPGYNSTSAECKNISEKTNQTCGSGANAGFCSSRFPRCKGTLCSLPEEFATQPTKQGYCADDQRNNAVPIKNATCDIKNETTYNGTWDSFCETNHNKPRYYECTLSQNVTTPGNGDEEETAVPQAPTSPGDGWCGPSDRSAGGEKSARSGEATPSCTFNNSTYVSQNEYCRVNFGGSLANFYSCSTSGTGGEQPVLTPPSQHGFCAKQDRSEAKERFCTNSSAGNSEENKYCQQKYGGDHYWFNCTEGTNATLICAGKGIDPTLKNGYLDSICTKDSPPFTQAQIDNGKFTSAKAQANVYKDGKYYDVYKCADGSFESQAGGTNICNSPPWTGSLQKNPQECTDPARPYPNPNKPGTCMPDPNACPNVGPTGKTNICQASACGAGMNPDTSTSTAEANAACGDYNSATRNCCLKPTATGGTAPGGGGTTSLPTPNATATCATNTSSTDMKFTWSQPNSARYTYTLVLKPARNGSASETLNPTTSQLVTLSGYRAGQTVSFEFSARDPETNTTSPTQTGSFTIPATCQSQVDPGTGNPGSSACPAGNMKSGCLCPNGGGCASGYTCRTGAGTTTQYCTGNGMLWCPLLNKDVSNADQCTTQTSTQNPGSQNPGTGNPGTVYSCITEDGRCFPDQQGPNGTSRCCTKADVPQNPNYPNLSCRQVGTSAAYSCRPSTGSSTQPVAATACSDTTIGNGSAACGTSSAPTTGCVNGVWDWKPGNVDGEKDSFCNSKSTASPYCYLCKTSSTQSVASTPDSPLCQKNKDCTDKKLGNACVFTNSTSVGLCKTL